VLPKHIAHVFGLGKALSNHHQMTPRTLKIIVLLFRQILSTSPYKHLAFDEVIPTRNWEPYPSTAGGYGFFVLSFPFFLDAAFLASTAFLTNSIHNYVIVRCPFKNCLWLPSQTRVTSFGWSKLYPNHRQRNENRQSEQVCLSENLISGTVDNERGF
jgi:hypothetical protein